MGGRRPFEFAFRSMTVIFRRPSKCSWQLRLSYFAVIPAQAGIHLLNFSNCFSNIGFLTLYADSRRSLSERMRGRNDGDF